MEFNIGHVMVGKSVDGKQCRLLYRLAKESIGPIVEIGSYRGRSTIALATGAKEPVYAIDPWYEEDASFSLFWQNMVKAGVNHKVRPIQSKSQDVKLRIEIGLLFLDGTKKPEGILQDFEWIKKVKLGGVVAIHDYGTSKNMTHCVNEHIIDAKLLTGIDKERNLIVLRKDI